MYVYITVSYTHEDIWRLCLVQKERLFLDYHKIHTQIPFLDTTIKWIKDWKGEKRKGAKKIREGGRGERNIDSKGS